MAEIFISVTLDEGVKKIVGCRRLASYKTLKEAVLHIYIAQICCLVSQFLSRCMCLQCFTWISFEILNMCKIMTLAFDDRSASSCSYWLCSSLDSQLHSTEDGN